MRLLGARLAKDDAIGAETLIGAAFLCAVAAIGSEILAILVLEALVDADAGVWLAWLMLLIAFGSVAVVIVGLDLADGARARSPPRTRIKIVATGVWALNIALLVPALIWTLIWVVLCLILVFQWGDQLQ